MKYWEWIQNAIGTTLLIVLFACLAAPGIVSAEDDIQSLKQQLDSMSKEMEAVQEKIAYIEGHYLYALKTVGGITSAARTGNGVFATFTHATSRENDPQLHTHTLIMNMTHRSRRAGGHPGMIRSSSIGFY